MTTYRTKKDFSFGDYAGSFDAHIRASIPGFQQLVDYTVDRSVTYVQRGTTVIDVGCSTGRTLAAIRRVNQAARPNVDYLGIDTEPRFRRCWEKHSFMNFRCEVGDALTHPFDNVSLACCIMTLLFLRPADKLPLLKRIRSSMVEGGALLIAEKTLAETSRQESDAQAAYVDFKRRRGFTADEILEKQSSLRGHMTKLTERELRTALVAAGFRDIEPYWRGHMFVALVALT
ncbi:methyltransferase domain-containing protein [Bradyrhizobium yuanmingense]|uniref:methyltransferase domain-containing protein n=1 Tax=Bradyrhizobium yuanmingense TaxID=108015 RepID=UPI0021A5431E|nr:methyltransferase [Bradyrhizobium sp. CB1024]UWU84925.1 methyltransferase domain-containing protein [Bradyrhizobium sp. CB1024]